MAELLAPDDRAAEAARVRSRGQVVAECAVGRLELAELQRVVRVAVGIGRQVDIEVGAVADREVLESQVVTPRRDLDDRRGPTAEMEVIGALEGAAGERDRNDRGTGRGRGRRRRWGR